MMLPSAFRVIPAAVLLAIACDHDVAGPAESATPVVLSTGLDPSYPTLAASGSDRIFTVRLNDATTRLLDARNASGGASERTFARLGAGGRFDRRVDDR